MPATALVELTGTAPAELLKIKRLARVVVRRVMAYNGDTADHRVQIGVCDVRDDGTLDAATFRQILPDIVVLAGQTVVVETPPAAAQSTRDRVRALAARLEGSATTPVQVVVEWEEA